MRNIFLFISRYFNFLFFLLLQGVCIYFITSYSKYHQAAFGAVTNNVTGKINTEYNKVEYYFQLKRTNDSLLKANERLYNILRSNYDVPDSLNRTVIDTLRIDSLTKYRKLNFISAKVVSNSVSAQNNFIVLQSSQSDLLKPGMGVVDVNNSIVGIVTEVDGNYAVVMSLLHKDSHISGKLKKTGETGTLNWDGKEPNNIFLSNIPKSARITKGDSIISSGFSTSFPMGLMIGRVEEVYADAATTNYKVKFRTAANFYNLQYAYVIINADQEPVKKIIDKIKTQ
ncbi:MAG: rod shape-determining protein MreC [Ferruginibacter sp.]